MRALIRDLRTGSFYGPDGQWTAAREKGCEFESTFQALTFAGDNHLHGVEVVMTFGAPEYDLTISREPEGRLRKVLRRRVRELMSIREEF